MSNIGDEFSQFYAQQVLDIEDMTDVITRQYVIEACLKDAPGKQTLLLRSRDDGRQYVLKRAVRAFQGELENEYMALTALQNVTFPGVVTYFEDGEYTCFVREYIQGCSLYSLIEDNGTLSEQKAVELAIAVCRSLECLHHQDPPLIHRDIKPQNIILTPEGRPVLIDMGISRRYKEDALQDTAFMGTQATAAPEQYGFGQTDARCDIYATGILLAFLLTGGFSAGRGILQSVTPQLRRIILKCTELDPDRRYPDAHTLRRHLQGCLVGRKRLVRLCAFAAAGIALFAAGAGIASALYRPGVVQAAAIQPSLSPLAAPTLPQATPSPGDRAIYVPPAPSPGVSAPAVIPGQKAVFHSPLIEKAVRMELGKKEGEPIKNEELAGVKHLMICGETIFSDLNRYFQYATLFTLNGEPVYSRGDITSLEDIRLLPNLDTLILDRQNIADISALSGMHIRKLGLCDNQISDLSALSTCGELIYLKLDENPYGDLAPLAALKNLGTLDIGLTNVTDLSPVAGLPIRYLYLVGTPVKDYQQLKRMTKLEELKLQNVDREGLEAVKTLKSLSSLTIYDSGITDIGQFAALPNLGELDVSFNSVEDLAGVELLSKLQTLRLGGNPVRDLTPLLKLVRLSSLDIPHTEVADVADVVKLPNLQYLSCDQGQADIIKKIKNKPFFKMEIKP